MAHQKGLEIFLDISKPFYYSKLEDSKRRANKKGGLEPPFEAGKNSPFGLFLRRGLWRILYGALN